MSNNGVRPEQQQILPWSYPQYYEPQAYFHFQPGPRKDRSKTIAAVVVALVAGLMIVPMVLSSILYATDYEMYEEEYYYDDHYDDGHFYNNTGTIFVFRDNETTPIAFVSSVNVESPTKATIHLSNFTRDPAATEFRLILERDDSSQGTYEFPTDTDCELVLVDGMDIADLYYVDSNRNLELDPGDEISITNLTPSSFYQVTIIYIPNGYESTYCAFWTRA